jgi:iron complex outermembrane receptor protein
MGEYGFYDTNHGDIPSYRTGLNLSGPILEDKFYIAVSGLFDASDGYMQNEFDNSDDAGKYKHKNARASLRWTPADAWDISLTMDVMDYDDKPDYYHFVTGPMASKRNTVNYDYTNSHWDQDSNGQALKVKYKGRLFDLTSVTGHRTYESDSNPEFDCSTLPWPSQTLNYENKFLSQEFRISSKAKSASPFAWLTGVYAYQDETDTHTDFPAMMQARLAEMKFKGLAFFGQGTYTFFDRLHLTGGLRLDYTDAEGAMNLINMGSPSTFDQSFDKTVLLPKLALAYDVSPDIKPYASVSRGYLAGGFSYGFAENKDNFTYDPEYTTNYELGVKTSWLENKLSANLALFRIDMTDRQVSQYVEGAMVGMRKISNVAEAYSQGVELEMRAKPCQGLMLSAGLGLIQAEVKNWVSTQHGPSGIVKEDLSGKRLPNAPSYTYNLGAMYRHDSGFFGRVDLNGVGDMYTDAQNTEITKIESYQLVNLRLGYETESLSLVLWAKNLFDKDYYTVTYAWRDGSVLAGDGAPRSVGLTLTYRF